MKIQKIDTPAGGTWARDCELMALTDHKQFVLYYRREEDNTYWTLKCNLIVAYKVISEEFSTSSYLFNLPRKGAFFEILDSPWIREFGPERSELLDKCKHYVLEFYDEVVEIIAQQFIFEQLKEKPIINC